MFRKYWHSLAPCFKTEFNFFHSPHFRETFVSGMAAQISNFSEKLKWGIFTSFGLSLTDCFWANIRFKTVLEYSNLFILYGRNFLAKSESFFLYLRTNPRLLFDKWRHLGYEVIIILSHCFNNHQKSKWSKSHRSKRIIQTIKIILMVSENLPN